MRQRLLGTVRESNGLEGSDGLAGWYQPVGSYYLVRFLEAETESAGGIALPETALPDVQSALVLAHGSGPVLANGRRYPMQGAVGDVVVSQSFRFERMDGQAFLADESLVALQRWDGEGHGALQAAGDWVLVRPDGAKQVDAETRATVQARESGVLVACASVGGGHLREQQRGDEIVRELEALVRTEAFRQQPSEFYRHRMIHDYLDGLCQWELQALGTALKRKGETNWRHYVPPRPLARASAGVVVSVGPGRVLRDGTRRPPGVRPGDRVHFDRQFQAVALLSEGDSLWAVREQFLAAVEVTEEKTNAGS